MEQDDEERLAGLFEAHYRAVLAYLVRRSDPDTAQEVAADVFVVAWRRLDDVPTHARPWLLVVAKNSLANHQRGRARRGLAEARLQDRSVTASGFVSDPDVAQRLDLARALDKLSDADRELLLLIAWDELTPAEAATVLGCRAASVRVRLHRARTRLASVLAQQETAHPIGQPSTSAPGGAA